MGESHAAGWPSDGPTAAQLKEFFAQIEQRRITKDIMQDIILGNYTVGNTAFRFDKREDGWELAEDQEIVVPASLLEATTFLRRGESSISGEEMRRRSVELGANLGQRQAEYLLDHQEEIPKEWRAFYLVFPGTFWRDRDGDLEVPCLRCYGGRWNLHFFWLGGDWGSSARLVRARK
ncbi:MAG: hypothetical protein WEC39_01625 [Patescibacteria group bacterium]